MVAYCALSAKPLCESLRLPFLNKRGRECQRIETYYIYEPTPHNPGNHYVLQMWINKMYFLLMKKVHL